MDGAPVDELSFYDQPGSDAIFSTISPNLQQQQQYDGLDQTGSRRRMRRSSSTSSIHSQVSTASEASTASCASSTSSCSSIEQVFFGPQSDKEKKLVAKLSRQTAQLELASPSRASHRREISNRLKKKDSLEFNRRRTLGFSSRTNVEGQQSRRWEGGLLEKTNAPKSSTPLRQANTPKRSTPLRITRNMNTVCSSPEDDVFSISCSRTKDFRIQTPTIANAHVSARNTPPDSPFLAAADSPTGSLSRSPHLLTDRMDMSANDSAFVTEDNETGNFVRLDSDQEGTQAGSLKSSSGLANICSSAKLTFSVGPDETSGDSDKENNTNEASYPSTRSQTQTRTALAEIDVGKVFQELSLSGASLRKSLRDRKGDRSGRISGRNGPAEAVSISLNPMSPALQAIQSVSAPTDTKQMPPDHGQCVEVLEDADEASDKQPTATLQEPSNQVLQSSERFQAVLREGSTSPSPFPGSSNSTVKDDDKANSSFDPDSPLPVPRAPRHSLLLALTTSPMQFETTSPSKSSSGSPSPSKMEPAFAPEYQSMATPIRLRQTLDTSAFEISETPLGQTTLRHRDARTLRKEQATMERQATISDKLNAVSLAMSGLKASAYGTSSIEPRAILQKQEPKEIQQQTLQLGRERSKTPPAPILKNPVVLEPPCTIFPELKDQASVAAVAATPSRAKSPTKPSVDSQGTGLHQPSVIDPGQSRIPKSVVPPSQPVFRKPMVSGLPVSKPSMLPTKSLSNSTTQKAAPITMSFKAVRPEGGAQPELPRYATPIKARLPSTLAFRSPAASRIMAATNPAKPLHGRSVSGSMASSVSGAVRPMTPGKNRSISAGEAIARPETSSVGSGPIPSALVRQSALTQSVASLTILKSTTDDPPTSDQTAPSDTDTRVASLNQAMPDSPQITSVDVPRPQVPPQLPSQAKPPTLSSPARQSVVASAEVVATSRPDETIKPHPSTSIKSVVQPRRAVVARATRAVRPGAAAPPADINRQPVRKTPEVKRVQISTVPDKELGTITKLNTARNEVYYCTLDRNIVKKDGPRPESPSKVRTIAEREEEEKKLGREARAKRRGTGTRSGDCSSDPEGGDRPLSLAELLPPLKHVRGAGEEEDYQTPARPLKRGRKSAVTSGADDPSPTNGPKRKKSCVTLSKAVLEAGEDKFVRWDRGLVVIERPEPSVPQHHREGEPVPSIKSCLKRKESIQLDHLGNLPHATAPIPKLKRNRIPVYCFWYDGEEPPVPVVSTPVPSVVASSSAGSRRGKK